MYKSVLSKVLQSYQSSPPSNSRTFSSPLFLFFPTPLPTHFHPQLSIRTLLIYFSCLYGSAYPRHFL